jgi:DNA-binding response OmpR family regulator
VSHSVLIVDSDPAELNGTARLLTDAGYHVTTSDSFENARRCLKATPPDLLVADVRLGDYNGIHLVIRGRTHDAGLPAIVTDTSPDPAGEADATRQGAVYLPKPFAPRELLGVARDLVGDRPTRAATGVTRRWPRLLTSFEELPVKIGDAEARVLDISYRGLRLEVDDLSEDYMQAKGVAITSPWFQESLTVRPVWARRPPQGSAWWYGVELYGVSASTEQAWRLLVDTFRQRTGAPGARETAQPAGA